VLYLYRALGYIIEAQAKAVVASIEEFAASHPGMLTPPR
jgi:hypothetical protein